MHKVFALTLATFSLTLLGGCSLTGQNSNEPQTYTLADVQAHATKEDCWTIVNDKVYDITSLIPKHVAKNVVKGCGIDGTGLFLGTDPEGKEHSEEATAKMAEYLIGDYAIEE